MAVVAYLFEFWKDKEKELGRDISVIEVNEATGISRTTLTRLRKPGGVKNPAPETVDKLCKFFNVAEGQIPFVIYKPD